ncbi:MAG: aminotransferase class I and II [Paramuribaculum sp.]|nr:aminotransferase class I and II [Paramuribaculum sp.]
MEQLRRERLTRYIEPFREGGSLPGLAEASDGFKYVVKWRGGGHGAKVLVAELLGGEIARAAGMRVPELVILDTPVDFGRTEPDIEVQELLRDSTGLNLGLHFLSGALTMDPYVNPVTADEASRIVWLDMFLTNVDRTVKNTNMLVWHGKETWLIDHGASFFFHHSWSKTPEQAAAAPFPYIRDHALIRKAEFLEEADSRLRQILTPERLAEIVDLIPEEWLVRDDLAMTPEELRNAYTSFLVTRLNHSSDFTREAIKIRKDLIS